MKPNTWRERDTFSKILSLPICTSCMPNILSSRRVFQHRIVHPTVQDSNVCDEKAGFGRTNQEGYFLSKTG